MVSLNQIRATFHILMVQAIDAALDSNPELDLLGQFAADAADVNAIQVRKTIYLPAPFLGSSWSET